MLNRNITYIAHTNFRNSNQRFGIHQADRLSHTYIIGKTGTGKTTLLASLIKQDVVAGRGLALLDPHGDLVEEITSSIPQSRKDDVVYVDVANIESGIGYNPLHKVAPAYRTLVASGIMEVFKKLHDKKSWGVRMEHILRNVLLTLLDQPHADFSDIPRILQDKDYRRSCLVHIKNSSVKEFWTEEYEKYPFIVRASAISPIQNKIGAFLSTPVLKQILVENKQQIRLRSMMDEGKILLINLAKGRIGEDASHLLGGLLINALGLAAFSRQELPEAERKLYLVYADEFQNFTTRSLVNMLSELRKYRVGMVLAHQYLNQLDKETQDAVLGNIGTLIAFRLGPHDARLLAREFAPKITELDIMHLPNYHIYLKLMIDGSPSKAFSATMELL